MALLKVEQLNVKYGAIHAVKGINLEVEEGKIVTILGANGAGKTSILNAISGLIDVDSGSVIYKDDVTLFDSSKSTSKKIIKKSHAIPTEKQIKLGISHCPEGRKIFSNLTVEENLEMGAFSLNDKTKMTANIKKMYELFPRLEERKRQVAGTLSGGEQQMLAMARALMIDPKLLLLDEPSMGLSPLLVSEIFDIIKRIKKLGTTILLVEQNAMMALSIADYGYVIETGNVVLKGEASKLLNDPEVKKAYLGA